METVKQTKDEGDQRGWLWNKTWAEAAAHVQRIIHRTSEITQINHPQPDNLMKRLKVCHAKKVDNESVRLSTINVYLLCIFNICIIVNLGDLRLFPL